MSEPPAPTKRTIDYRLLVPLLVGLFTHIPLHAYLEQVSQHQYHGSFWEWYPSVFSGAGNFATPTVLPRAESGIHQHAEAIGITGEAFRGASRFGQRRDTRRRHDTAHGLQELSSTLFHVQCVPWNRTWFQIYLR